MNNFKALVGWLKQAVTDKEQFHLGYADESSEFVRFNHAKAVSYTHLTLPTSDLV